MYLLWHMVVTKQRTLLQDKKTRLGISSSIHYAIALLSVALVSSTEIPTLSMYIRTCLSS